METGKNIFRALCVVVAVFFATRVQAQFMPVVYNRSYGEEIHYKMICADFNNGDVVAVGESGSRPILSWFDRHGESILSRKFPDGDFTKIAGIFPLQDGEILLVGSCTLSSAHSATVQWAQAGLSSLRRKARSNRMPVWVSRVPV